MIKITKVRFAAVVLLIVLVASILLLCGCDDDFETDKVMVVIKAEYKEKFLQKEFTVEDFNWNNIDRIEYRSWYENIEPERGRIVVYLKRTGKYQVRKAVRLLSRLEFVEHVGLNEIINIVQ